MSPVGRFQTRTRLVYLSLFAGLLWLAAGTSVSAQQNAAEEHTEESHEGSWKIVNTALFAIALGWYLKRNAPRFFNARSLDIQKAIKDATGLKIEADFRYSAIDKRMAHLADEVEKIREQAKTEMEREHGRIRQQTEQEIEHMRANAGNEIEALRKEGSQRVGLRTAQLALGLAERRLQERFSQGEPPGVIDDFVRLVERGNN